MMEQKVREKNLQKLQTTFVNGGGNNEKIINLVEKSIRELGNPGTNNSDLIPDLSNHKQ